MKPDATPDSFVDDVIGKTTRRHCEAAWIYGTPEQAAGQDAAYAAEGLNWIGPVDYMPTVPPVEESAMAFQNSIEVFRHVKAKTGATVLT